MAEFSFHHGGVSVPDIEQAIDWYGRVLGFDVEKRFYIAAARTKATMLRKGPLRIELFEPEDCLALPEDRRDIQTHCNKHVAFRVNDLELFLAEMADKHVDIAFIVREGFGSGCFIRDPAGNLIEFVEEPAL